MLRIDNLVQLLLGNANSCTHRHLGGIDGMSKVQRDDDAGTVLGFLSHFLRLEMHQLRRDHRSDDFQQSTKEPGRTGPAAGAYTLRPVFGPDPRWSCESQRFGSGAMDPVIMRVAL
jgi:hypothetical protein